MKKMKITLRKDGTQKIEVLGASGASDERGETQVHDVAMSEPPPVPRKPKRVFEV